MAHASIAQREISHGRWFSYTAWSPLIVVFSGNSRFFSLRVASVALLSGAVALKAVLSRRVAEEWGAGQRTSLMTACALIVATPVVALGIQADHGATDSSLMNGAIYLGRFSTAWWHNSTSIAAVPLILVAVILVRRALAVPSNRSTMLMGLSLAASAVMKPNFVLAALPVFALVLVRRLSVTRPTTRGSTLTCLLWAVVPATVVLLAQFELIRSDPVIVQTRITWDPLVVWRYYAPSPWLALGQSMAFPIMATFSTLMLCRRGQWWLWCCWAVMGVGIAQVALLGERSLITGELSFDGNWFWGPHAALLVLFLACAASLAGASKDLFGVGHPQRSQRGLTGLVVCSWVVLCLHTATGVLYIWRLFEFSNGFAT